MKDTAQVRRKPAGPVVPPACSPPVGRRVPVRPGGGWGGPGHGMGFSAHSAAPSSAAGRGFWAASSNTRWAPVRASLPRSAGTLSPDSGPAPARGADWKLGTETPRALQPSGALLLYFFFPVSRRETSCFKK